MPGQAIAAAPAAMSTTASARRPTTGPARSDRNARAASMNAARNAYTANRMTNAPIVMLGQATAMMPTAIARIPLKTRVTLELFTGSLRSWWLIPPGAGPRSVDVVADAAGSWGASPPRVNPSAGLVVRTGHGESFGA